MLYIVKWKFYKFINSIVEYNTDNERKKRPIKNIISLD